MSEAWCSILIYHAVSLMAKPVWILSPAYGSYLIQTRVHRNIISWVWLEYGMTSSRLLGVLKINSKAFLLIMTGSLQNYVGLLIIAFQTQTHSFHSTVKQLLLYGEHPNTDLPLWAQSDPSNPTSSHMVLLSEVLPLSHLCKVHFAAAWVNSGGQEEFSTH